MKYEWPSEIGDTAHYPFTINVQALRSAASMRGTRYGQWFSVTRGVDGYVVKRVEHPPSQVKTNSRAPVDLMDAIRGLTLLVLDLKKEVQKVVAYMEEMEDVRYL